MKTPRTVLAATLAVLSISAQAGTQIGENLTLSGFGTAGVVVTDTDLAEFRADPLQPRGATKSADFGVDSRLGLQADFKLNDTFSAVSQVIISRRENDRPVVEWLYGKAALPADFDLKIGRMVLPVFMVSDSRLVGYASHWLRTPSEVYQQYPATSFDGIQLQKRARLGSFNLTGQWSMGDSEQTVELVTGPSKVEIKRINSLGLQAEVGDLMASLAYTTAGKVKLSGLPLPVTKDTFTALGLQYDDGAYVARAEYVKRTQKPSLFDSYGWYISAGMRLGAWTPYATISEQKLEGPFFQVKDSPKTTALGLRWDAMPNVAVKFQAQSSKGGGANIGFIKAKPAFFTTKPSVKVYSAAVDFVF